MLATRLAVTGAIVGFMFAGRLATPVFPAGGMTKVAEAGRAVGVQESWPEGTRELVNDPTHADGWNDWFSQWPSDVMHYEFKVSGTDDVNRLIDHLAKVKSPLRQINLSCFREPRGLGWVASLPEGNGTPVMFSIGNQEWLDRWYSRLNNGKFGGLTFEAAPVAVAPTLTIFVANPAIDLTALKIPPGIEVSAGDVPRLFRKWNTTREREAAAATIEPARTVDAPDPQTQAMIGRIDAYLKARKTRE